MFTTIFKLLKIKQRVFFGKKFKKCCQNVFASFFKRRKKNIQTFWCFSENNRDKFLFHSYSKKGGWVTVVKGFSFQPGSGVRRTFSSGDVFSQVHNRQRQVVKLTSRGCSQGKKPTFERLGSGSNHWLFLFVSPPKTPFSFRKKFLLFKENVEGEGGRKVKFTWFF